MFKYKATHVQAPSFARKFKEYLAKNGVDINEHAADIELRSLRDVFNAAEPIDVSAMKAFIELFGNYGLGDAFSPGFGLAENSVNVCDHGKTVTTVDKKVLESENTI